MEFKNLCTERTQEEIESFINKHGVALDGYFSFLLQLSDNDKIKNKIQKNIDNLVYYIVESKQTPIPRNFNGVNKPCTLKSGNAAAMAFVREQIVIDETAKENVVKPGIAVLVTTKNVDKAFHEVNHAATHVISFFDQENQKIKIGMNVYQIKDDAVVGLTGNLFDEVLTDAIAAHYYNLHINDFKDNDGSVRVYNGAGYNSIRNIGTILLGKDLSNKLLLNAYFGDIEDLENFEEHFNGVMKQENITFEQLLKTGFSPERCIDGVVFSNEELYNIAYRYRFNLCKTQDELVAEQEFLASLDIDINSGELQASFSKRMKEIEDLEACRER